LWGQRTWILIDAQLHTISNALEIKWRNYMSSTPSVWKRSENLLC
jgi:hypothetical protein